MRRNSKWVQSCIKSYLLLYLDYIVIYSQALEELEPVKGVSRDFLDLVVAQITDGKTKLYS